MRAVFAAAFLAVVLLAAGCRSAAPVGLVGELGRVAGGAREPGPRLSISSVGRCSDLRGAVRPCGARASGRRERRAREIAARAQAVLGERVDADALHAAGLVDLLWGDSAGRSLDRSIQSLRTAAEIAEAPAPVLADLSAAFLVRAERRDAARDLFEAAEAAGDALVAEPENAAARFNLALALERIGLVDAAGDAWAEFLALDDASPWADSARVWAEALRHVAPVLPPLRSPADADAFAAASPQEALYRGWDVVLAEWGEAVLAGDSARAAERLAMADALGDALVRQGRDESLADAVAAVRGVEGDEEEIMRLAEGHARYGEGRRVYLEGRYVAAAEHLEAAISAGTVSRSIKGWGRLFHAGALGQTGRKADREKSQAMIDALVAETDSARYPSLAGRARWASGTLHLRSGRYEPAWARYRAAEVLFERAGEAEHHGWMRCSAAISELALGDLHGTFASLQSALLTLRPFRSSVWLHNCLSFAGTTAADEELRGSAAHAHGEDIGVTRRLGNSMYGAEAFLHRARLHAAGGAYTLAAADVDSAASLIAGIHDEGGRRWFTADLALARGTLLARNHPRRAASELDSAVSYFSSVAMRFVPALALRAHVRLAGADYEGATADLARAAEALHSSSSLVEKASLRGAMTDAAAPIIDRLISLLASRGRDADALAVLERARSGFGSAPTSEPEITPPTGTVAVSYALIGDTLFAWRLRGTDLRLTRASVHRADLIRTGARVRAALEGHGGTATVRSDLEALHRWLIAPLDLGTDSSTLLIVADGEIAGVPFAALRDARRERFLIEDRPVRFATSLQSAQAEPRPRERGSMLLVADPAFDRAAYPELERLPGAGSEVRRLVASYPTALVLEDSAADAASVAQALLRADLVHYAGHAVFDDTRPERSFLVLAGHPGRLSAAELSTLDLRGIRLIVLAACRTLPGRNGRSGGFAGMSGALVSAGAGGVLGSLWRVDDRLTSALMARFHAEYRASGDPSRALRRSQLALLRSSDPAHQSPAAWAGFRYAGE